MNERITKPIGRAVDAPSAGREQRRAAHRKEAAAAKFMPDEVHWHAAGIAYRHIGFSPAQIHQAIGSNDFQVRIRMRRTPRPPGRPYRSRFAQAETGARLRR